MHLQKKTWATQQLTMSFGGATLQGPEANLILR